MLDDIKNLITKNDSVIISNFKGQISNDMVRDFYKTSNCNLFLQVSTSEGIPVSIMEALSFGIPIMATNVGGVGEILSGEGYSIILDRNLDEKILAENIKKLILLPQENIAQMRLLARKEWEANWNGEINYSNFANFLQAISSLE